MQATVATYDPDSRSGSVLLDDGHELPFAGEALDRTGLRFLRPGQRVSLEMAEESHIDRVQILTLR